MVLIPTRVLPSRIPDAGYGLFARDDVAAGTVIWRWMPPWDRGFTPEEVSGFTPLMLEHLSKYGWWHEGEWRISLDDSRYTNHSSSPNTRHVVSEGVSIATRLILAGEEILEDYSEFDPDFEAYAASLR